MNEKFKKDEVWGNLGKSKANGDQNEDSLYHDDLNVEFPQAEVKVKCYSSLTNYICMLYDVEPSIFFFLISFGFLNFANSLFIRRMTFLITYQATLLIMDHVMEGAGSLNRRGLITRSVFPYDTRRVFWSFVCL